MTTEQVFEQHHRAVFGFAYRLTRSIEAAEDITQECFLVFVRAPERFDRARATVKTYLFSIARNLVLKHYRSGRAETPLEEEWELAGAGHTAVDVSLAVEHAVAALPPLQQEALVLFEYHGFTLEEIAGVVDADVGAVKSRLHRARASLKVTLAPYRKVGNTHGAV